MMSPAPIALFAYNRPDHLRRTVEALRRNELASQSELQVFSDGPKTAADEPAVEAVRKYLAQVTGFRSVEVQQRAENMGLARSIVSGVTELSERYGQVIVLEDDLVTAPWFLRFMNDGLRQYAHVPEVISIHGYIYPVEAALPETFFLQGADCWGWATWQRAWRHFNPDGRSLLDQLEARHLTDAFDFDRACGYTELLRGQIAGRNSSWAVRWYAAAFLLGKLTLYPGRSLVQNIGFDNTGAHCPNHRVFDVRLSESPIKISEIPLEDNREVRRQLAAHFRDGGARGLRRFWKRVRGAWKELGQRASTRMIDSH